jgi:hypothetical protein
VDMPATPFRLWEAMRSARSGMALAAVAGKK